MLRFEKARRPAALALAAVGWITLAIQLNIIVGGALANGKPVMAAVFTLVSFFTILTNILVVVCLTISCLSTSASRPSPSIMTAVALYITIVGIVYALLLRKLWAPQGWQLLTDVLLHDVMPVMFVLFWLIFVPKGTLRWSAPVLWLAYPLAYLGVTLVRGAATGFYPYPFINILVIGPQMAIRNSILLAVAFLVLGEVMALIDRVMGWFSNRAIVSKRGGGNAHQRAVQKSSRSRIAHSVSTETRTERPISWADRFSRLIASGWVQTFFGSLAVLPATLLDGRYLSILALCLLLALHDKRVLENLPKIQIAMVYFVLFFVSAVGLHWIGVWYNQKRPNIFTPQEYANAVASVIPRNLSSEKSPRFDPPKKPHPLKQPLPSPPKVLVASDIEVVACMTALKPNQTVNASRKFEGATECKVRFTNKSDQPLKGATINIWTDSGKIKFDTEPPSILSPVDIGPNENKIHTVAINQTLIEGGDPFLVALKFPNQRYRIDVQFKIVKEDGHALGQWGIEMVPEHESN